MIHMLATHPSTAKFVSTKLARKFISDNPPPALVARMSQAFLKTDGDIREVLRTMFKSPEFFATENYRAKIKTPFEMTVSAVRAIGADTNAPRNSTGGWRRWARGCLCASRRPATQTPPSAGSTLARCSNA